MPIPAGSTTAIVTLTDVRYHLNYPNPTQTSTDDAELQGFIDAATDVIRAETSDIIATQYTETRDGMTPTIILDHAPVISIVSITDYIGLNGYPLTSQPPGSTVDNYGYSIDNAEAGLISRRSSAGTVMPFYGGPKMVVVTYVAGRASVPPSVRLAALELIAHWWQASQQGSASTPGGGSIGGTSGYDQDDTQGGYQAGVPYRVLELLKPYRHAQGIA